MSIVDEAPKDTPPDLNVAQMRFLLTANNEIAANKEELKANILQAIEKDSTQISLLID